MLNKFILRPVLRIIAIMLIRYLQKRYKAISLNSKFNLTTQKMAKLKLIQAILYFFKTQFYAWGYFHPSCIWSAKDETFYRK